MVTRELWFASDPFNRRAQPLYSFKGCLPLVTLNDFNLELVAARIQDQRLHRNRSAS
jgi:hypothetical protein